MDGESYNGKVDVDGRPRPLRAMTLTGAVTAHNATVGSFRRGLGARAAGDQPRA